MGTQQLQKRAVASTQMQTQQRKNYPGSKIPKPSELSCKVLYVNRGVNTMFQKYISRLKIPATQREQHPHGGFTNIKRHSTKFNLPEFVHHLYKPHAVC
jgi:hypothetical protein